MTSERHSVVDIEYAYERKFKPPIQPDFSILGSLLSIASLALMTGLSVIMLLQLRDPTNALVSWSWLQPPHAERGLAAWTWLPFAFTIFGAGLGMMFELGLLLAGTAFQQARTKFTRFIVSLRLVNLAPVTGTIFFFTICMIAGDADLRLGMLFVAAFFSALLAFGLFFGNAPTVPAMLLGLQLSQILLVLLFGARFGGTDVSLLLIGQAALQFAALMIGTATPIMSTKFHTISTLSGVLLYWAIVQTTALQPDFSHDVAIALPEGSLTKWAFVATLLLGLIFAARAFPGSFAAFRSQVSELIWSPIYFLLVSQPRFANPRNLSALYDRHGTPAKLKFQPYFLQHAEDLIQPLSIPSPESLEANVTIFKAVLKRVKGAFAMISLFDHILPQADVSTPLAVKPRLDPWSYGSEYWPTMFRWNIFGATLPQRELAAAPKPAIEAYKEGQLLAFLAQFGVAAPFAKPAKNRGPGALVADFSYLETLDTKADYHGYGGKAYFQVDGESRKLKLVSVVAPNTDTEITPEAGDPVFRLAESQVLASLYYAVICGKHLGEIHMTYNLVEASLHNAFDAEGQWNHPLRTVLYLHLFAHELAEELTTEHLVQDGAVFAQVFATTQDSLIDHLNQVYADFEYGEDEDFEARQSAMSYRDADGSEKILPGACIEWELEYASIWQRYADRIVQTLYADDKMVRDDIYLQQFHRQLLALIPKGLPKRYDAFRTRKGVSRYVSDTIHHLVIRHQVYGTTGVRAALDPRISSTQVPRDGGPPAVDEWRSLACVALATGAARFTLLMQDFDYLTEGVDPKYIHEMREAFGDLQSDLHALNAKWTESEADRQFNYDYFRAVPSDLHTGPGY